MEQIVSSPFLYNLALTLIHFLWQGGLIALALKLLLVVTSQQHAQLRYGYASIAMLASLIVPIVTFSLIYQPDLDQVKLFPLSSSLDLSNNALSNNSTTTWQHGLFDNLSYLALFWLTTVLVLASKVALELRNVNRLSKLGTIAPTEELATRFAQLVEKIALKRTPTLLISLKVNVPMAIGWLKPVVLIPATMLSGLTPAQLDMLLLHELAHIRRHDYIVNFIQTLVETLLFFHPAIRWVSKQMRNEREYCSDDIAVKVGGDPLAYAHTLADTASLCQKHRHHAIPTMAMAASGGDLKQRVVRLVDQHHCSSNEESGKFLASVLIIFSVLVIALKPYIVNPIFDITTGKISLFQTVSEFKQQPSNTVELSATTIAHLLLQDKENIEMSSPATLEEFQLAESELALAIADKPKTVLKLSINSQVEIASQRKNNKKEAIVPLENNKKDIQNIALTAPTKKIAPDTNTKVLLDKPVGKSMSDIAFERTAKSNKQAIFENPYADQVAELVNEPIPAKHSALSTKKLTSYKPRYTITSTPKPVVIYKPKKKSAEILRYQDPRYPSTAKRKGIELEVKVNFIIDKDGLVKDLVFEKKGKISYFKSSIRNALAKWRFLPAQLDGEPVESKMSKIFSFSLTE